MQCRQISSEQDEEEEDELDDFGTWLEAGLPALYEPQQNHPWVQILGALSHGALKV